MRVITRDRTLSKNGLSALAAKTSASITCKISACVDTLKHCTLGRKKVQSKISTDVFKLEALNTKNRTVL